MMVLKSSKFIMRTLDEDMKLLRGIYREIKELKKRIGAIDESLLDIKAMLLKEDEVCAEEKEEIEKLLSEPKDCYVTIEEFRRTLWE